jgi:glc operon protein GlcG
LIEQGAIIGAIGVSGGTDSQDEIVSKEGAAVINEEPASKK